MALKCKFSRLLEIFYVGMSGGRRRIAAFIGISEFGEMVK
jgi:hypothetical protein